MRQTSTLKILENFPDSIGILESKLQCFMSLEWHSIQKDKWVDELCEINMPHLTNPSATLVFFQTQVGKSYLLPRPSGAVWLLPSCLCRIRNHFCQFYFSNHDPRFGRDTRLVKARRIAWFTHVMCHGNQKHSSWGLVPFWVWLEQATIPAQIHTNALSNVLMNDAW